MNWVRNPALTSLCGSAPLRETGRDYLRRAGFGVWLAVMREVGQALRRDPAWVAKLAGDIEVLGVERLADSAVILRSRIRVAPPIEQWNVRRELLKRLKNAYDERGIEIPFPHLTHA